MEMIKQLHEAAQRCAAFFAEPFIRWKGLESLCEPAALLLEFWFGFLLGLGLGYLLL
ncbi:hypothetical protein MTAT_29700 [Moorella thermoacetica]|uniref:Uncharacterized protein n=2 Tax=Neomoorella thermoacetica TaxID=1525 RepID=A0AAC9HG93_NEOTH|nr:hypothetical protein [Moorella thermoacetica]AOQ23118.1 hypothetical protein Maut_00655 [Moorella thermoacetica]TYL07031.1 hypothetical protein MTAT_29700 [Moorella thermoacetica]